MARRSGQCTCSSALKGWAWDLQGFNGLEDRACLVTALQALGCMQHLLQAPAQRSADLAFCTIPPRRAPQVHGGRRRCQATDRADQWAGMSVPSVRPGNMSRHMRGTCGRPTAQALARGWRQTCRLPAESLACLRAASSCLRFPMPQRVGSCLPACRLPHALQLYVAVHVVTVWQQMRKSTADCARAAMQ